MKKTDHLSDPQKETEDPPCKNCITLAICRNRLKCHGHLYSLLIKFAKSKCCILHDYIYYDQGYTSIKYHYSYPRMAAVIKFARGLDEKDE